MKVSELIVTLSNARKKYGDLPVYMEVNSNVAINAICYVKGHGINPHYRITDSVDGIYEIYDKNPESDKDFVVEKL